MDGLKFLSFNKLSSAYNNFIHKGCSIKKSPGGEDLPEKKKSGGGRVKDALRIGEEVGQIQFEFGGLS